MYGENWAHNEVVFAKALAVDSEPQEKQQHDAANLPRAAAE
jgi:hypothetical protein